MKAHRELELSVLRMLMSAIKNKEIEKRAHPVRNQMQNASTNRPSTDQISNGGKREDVELSEEETMAVLRSEVKKRRDAIVEFQKGDRQDLADKEKDERLILEKYLPAEITDEEIEKILRPLVEGASIKDFGRIMGAAMKEIAGKASGDRVSIIVKRLFLV